MIRHWLAACVVSFSLLFAAAASAAACATPMQMDCCPGKQVDSSILCCVAAPAMAATALPATKSHGIAYDDVPAGLLPNTLHLPARSFAMARAGPEPLALPYLPDSSLTYLRTARLRL